MGGFGGSGRTQTPPIPKPRMQRLAARKARFVIEDKTQYAGDPWPQREGPAVVARVRPPQPYVRSEPPVLWVVDQLAFRTTRGCQSIGSNQATSKTTMT